MKKLILLLCTLLFLYSCNSPSYRKQACYDVLIDSIAKLADIQNRLTSLENTTNATGLEYETKIAELQRKVDSITKKQAIAKPVAKHVAKQKWVPKHAKPKYVAARTVEQGKTVKSKGYYYENNKQKYYYLDQRTKRYYSINPVTGEKEYL